jgi:hypothetical protein
MGFLGNIEQAEIAIENAHHLANGIRVKAFDRFQQMQPPELASVAQKSGETMLQFLNRGGGFRPCLGFQYLRQYRVQQTDRLAEFFVIR